MNHALSFARRQYAEITLGGWSALRRKARTRLPQLAALPAALLFLVFMRSMRPWFLIRIQYLISARIGHLAANVELYLCERDAKINVPQVRHVDLWYHTGTPNEQLAAMWARHLHIWPKWLLGQVFRLNKLIPGGSLHEIGNNTQHDRDVHNLLDRSGPHLAFTADEEARGRSGLRELGIPPAAKFVCLIGRDSAFLKTLSGGGSDYDYHSYRNVDIQNYILAAETLADLGYYVLRMGSVVNARIASDHPRVLDYACSGSRSDFMDVYLGAKCFFCISCATGFDAIPYIFRRPIAFVNMVPLGYLFTYRQDFIGICKKHWSVREGRWLSLKEIFAHGVGFSLRSADYKMKGVKVIENTPEEIRDLVLEMAERLSGTWQAKPVDERRQRRFWEIFPTGALAVTNGRPLHGEIRSRIGTAFLQGNPEWLD